MRVFRSIASVLGRVLQRLGRILLSWARRGEEASEADWYTAQDDGPPEHWLRYLRERAPWLVRGNGPSLVPRRTQDAGRLTHEEARGAELGSQEEARGARRGAQEVARGAWRVAHEDTPDSQSPFPSAAVLAHDGQPRDRASRPASSAPPSIAAQPAPERQHMGEGLGERAFRPAPRGPVLPPSGEKNEAPGGRALRPAPRAPVVPPSGEKAQDEGPRERVSRPTPRAPLLLPSEEKAESEGPDERALRPAPRAWIPDEGRIPDIREPAPHLEPAASLTDETNSDARERDTRLAPCAPDERWPELPETRWSEPSWEVPSSQSLVRLQQRLVRLQAEQAGSSWSGRHS